MERSFEVDQSRCAFALGWCKQESPAVQTWADRCYILSQIDSYWISAFRKNIPESIACDQWGDYVTSNMEFSEEIRFAGNSLVDEIRGTSLSHSEINHIITLTRASDSKWQLRAQYEAEEEAECVDDESPEL